MEPTGKITGWWNGKRGEGAVNHGPEWTPPEGEERLWKPMQERVRSLPGGVRLVAYDSSIEVRMGLWGDFRRRYRLALEALVHATEGGVISYSGRGDTPKHMQEAIRNRLKRWWGVAAYEHDLLLSGEAGESLIAELRADGEIPTESKFDDTVYLKGQGSHSSMLVKAYRLTKHGLPGVVKIETTFRKDYLRRHNMRQPELWATQPEIQESVVDALKKQWRTTLRRTPRTRRILAGELGVKQAELYDAIADSGNTLTIILREIERLSRITEEHERRMQELEREVARLRSITATEAVREW